MFSEMPGTSSQNTWTVGLILYFLSNYLSSCRSKEIQKTDKCQACACLLEVPRCAWKEVTSTLKRTLSTSSLSPRTRHPAHYWANSCSKPWLLARLSPAQKHSSLFCLLTKPTPQTFWLIYHLASLCSF